MKTAKNLDEAFSIQYDHDGKPHGWIQWKGTDVCMDFRCKCGYLSHIDGMAAYSVKCPKCSSAYFCSGYVELIKLEEEPDDFLIGDQDSYLELHEDK